MTHNNESPRERLLRIRREAANQPAKWDPEEAEGRCPECGLTGDHEDWCEDAIDTALVEES